MKLIVVPVSKFENTLPVIREQEALGHSYFRDERSSYKAGPVPGYGESSNYSYWCYKLFFHDGSDKLTYENRCTGEIE